jgi:Flp pilus assembly protein TadG
MKPQYKKTKTQRRHAHRDGAAVAEFGILTPLLALITFGAIDMGQGINMAQIVNDASREGARQATRLDVTDAGEVESAVRAFIAEAIPGQSADSLSSSVTVNVGDEFGTGIPAGDLTTVESGSPVSVQVVLAYDSVRWVPFLPGFAGATIETTTIMRRD